jgi:hypothetical protein
MYEPNIVSRVSDLNNTVVYLAAPRIMGRAVSLQTSEELSVLMQAAITNGTGRKFFSDALTNPVLSALTLGGKSGTINDENGSKVDWFVAFASPSAEGDKRCQLALAAVVVHDGRTNVASQELVRKALLAYYKPRGGQSGNQKVMARKKISQSRDRS